MLWHSVINTVNSLINIKIELCSMCKKANGIGREKHMWAHTAFSLGCLCFYLCKQQFCYASLLY